MNTKYCCWAFSIARTRWSEVEIDLQPRRAKPKNVTFCHQWPLCPRVLGGLLSRENIQLTTAFSVLSLSPSRHTPKVKSLGKQPTEQQNESINVVECRWMRAPVHFFSMFDEETAEECVLCGCIDLVSISIVVHSGRDTMATTRAATTTLALCRGKVTTATSTERRERSR